MSNSKFNIRLLTEIAFMAALAFVISLIPNTVYGWIIIEIACIPILLLSLRRGLAAGAFGGLIWGILALITGHAYILTLTQAGLEYLIAPVCLGLAGLFAQKTTKLKLFPVLSGIFIAVLVKYFFHFLAGIIFWSQYAWKGWGAVAYSLAVNGISGILTAVAAGIILSIFVKKFPKIFQTK
ncbi:energy-coupled thiamine transporter ThiT [Lactococcus kimchii]|uniref:energy-coupled thiamine transporter ThiT n=1 Tax=Lactococcus sp. S-13 TaxID=2507158 RepID=UPI0010233D02|nr:energy-coupled thiamine transporter ThiT [Lactococcus sp. S-13]RZI49712.1 energy-coupled thiamine transporter ThiT [Lactococcus sp. S-13]